MSRRWVRIFLTGGFAANLAVFSAVAAQTGVPPERIWWLWGGALPVLWLAARGGTP